MANDRRLTPNGTNAPKSTCIKHAQTPAMPAAAPAAPPMSASEVANRTALRQVLSMGLLGGTAGFGLRGLLGLPQMLRASQTQQVPGTGPTLVEMSYEPNKRKPNQWVTPAGSPRPVKIAAVPFISRMARGLQQAAKPLRAAGAAAGLGGAAAAHGYAAHQMAAAAKPSPATRPQLPPAGTTPPVGTPGLMGGVADAIYDNVLKPSGVTPALDTPLSANSNPAAKWWRNAAGLGLAGGAGYAGWRLADWMAEKYRDNEWERELADAEHEYLGTMKGLHAPKTAAMRETAVKLANMTAEVPQAAPGVAVAAPQPKMTPFDAGHVPGAMMNQAVSTALLSAIPFGLMSYHFVRDNSNSKALREALLLRQRLQHSRQSAPVRLVPGVEDESV